MGLETEFGCLVLDETLGSPESAVNAIKDHIFYDQRLGAIDLHSRDEVFEPAQSGGFLINGARLYIDAVGSHLEYATAECDTLPDLLAQEQAGDRFILELADQARARLTLENIDAEIYVARRLERRPVDTRGDLQDHGIHLSVRWLAF